MNRSHSPYDVIDVFAGPGGLGEGFASAHDEYEKPLFEIALSVERDEYAHKTLSLRHFLRHFPGGEIPDDYYSYLRNEISLDELYTHHNKEFRKAQESAPRITLGKETHDQVRQLIEQRLAGKKRWALVGGPPCQAYSLVGRSRMMGNPEFEQDERHFLYREYLKLIIDHRPPVFVMENVKGILSARIAGEPIINRIVSDLISPKAALEKNANGLGYRLHSLSEEKSPEGDVDPHLFLVKAEEYGVPQARHRMFIVGIREDLDVKPKQLRRHKPPTVQQTIGNLPMVRSGLSRGCDTPENWRKEISELANLNLVTQLNGSPCAKAIASTIELSLKDHACPDGRASTRYPGRSSERHPALDRFFDSRLSALTGHESRAHMASDLRRYLYAAVYAKETGKCPKLADFPEALLPDHANVDLGLSGKMFSDRFRVQLPHRTSTTITSHISKDGHYFIHYDPLQCRSLTVREAARLQTFPDNYKFEGSRTAQYHQVGNAVPPYLASQIAEIIADVLDTMRGKE